MLVLFLVVMLVPRRSRAPYSTDNKLDLLARRVEDVEKTAEKAKHDIANVRMSVGGLATKDSVNNLSVQVAEMRGAMTGLVSNTSATTRSIERIEDFLINLTSDALTGGSAKDANAGTKSSEAKS
ncbi:hypothetical protein ACFPQ7_06795 [Methylobacterium iners]|uniref:hypothetical protein n=1 Tax=Methylobacterium iners TaxID=418707 RepID=UPI00361D6768